MSQSRQRPQIQRLVQQRKLDLADRGSDVKLRELPGDHIGCGYFGHTLHTVGHSLGIYCGCWAALCSLTDDLLCRSLIRTLPSWACSSGQDLIQAGHTDGANQDSSHGACPQTTSPEGFLFWSPGDSPFPGLLTADGRKPELFTWLGRPCSHFQLHLSSHPL